VGLATIYLAITREKPNRVMEVLIGFIWVMFGITIIGLNVKSSNNASIDLFIPISDKYIGIILPVFVFSLFVMKGLLEIRSSLRTRISANTKGESFLSNFRITIWIIILAWITIVILIYLIGSQ
jgi:hypothetical protein